MAWICARAVIGSVLGDDVVSWDDGDDDDCGVKNDGCGGVVVVVSS